MEQEIDEAWHFPPELVTLLVDAVPRLTKGKLDQLNIFRGAGVAEQHLRDLAAMLTADKNSLGRYDIARTVLRRMNQDESSGGLRARRELLKRVTEWEDFGSCWPNDRDVAYARVAEIKKIVEVKDSFTRMRIVADRERQKNMEAAEVNARALQQRDRDLGAIKTDLFSLFSPTMNPWKRGKEVERVFTRLCHANGIAVREPFTVRGDEGKGVMEQIDGVISFEGNLYLVEIKWWDTTKPVDRPEVGYFFSKVMARADARGLFVAYPRFTSPAVECAKEALAHRVLVLSEVEELVRLLDARADLAEYLKKKVIAAVIDKNPLFKPSL